MEYLLLNDEKHILKDLVGEKLSLLYSHTLHYCIKDNTFSIHGTVILRTDDSFIMIESMELDCEENGYYDYYHTVSIKKSQFPDSLPYSKTEYGTIIFTEPVSSMAIFSKITKVSLFKQTVKLETKEIVFIGGIMIALENGEKMCLIPVAPVGFEINFDLENIDKLSKKLRFIESFQ